MPNPDEELLEKFARPSCAFAAAMAEPSTDVQHSSAVRLLLASLRADDLGDFETDTSSLITVIEGVRVGAPRLRQLFSYSTRQLGAPDNDHLAGAAAVNVLMRVGKPSDQLSDEDVGKTSSTLKEHRLVVAAFAFMTGAREGNDETARLLEEENEASGHSISLEI